ncbi:hypothetical protein D9M70_529200 [compost metagenome]
MQDLAWIHAGLGLSLVEPVFGAGSLVCGRQVEEGQKIARLEMRAGFLEVRLPLGVDKSRSGVGETACRIGGGGMALRFHKDRPSGTKTAEGVVEAPGDGDEFGRHGRVKIGTTEACCALERAVLVEDDAFADESCPGQKVGEAGAFVAIFSEVHHGRAPLDRQVTGDAQMPANDVDELRITPGRPYGGEMSGKPETEADQPEAQAQA